MTNEEIKKYNKNIRGLHRLFSKTERVLLSSNVTEEEVLSILKGIRYLRNKFKEL